MSMIPWQTRAAIERADANLRNTFNQHWNVMVIQLARRTGLTPEEVRQVLEAQPGSTPFERPRIPPMTVATPARRTTDARG